MIGRSRATQRGVDSTIMLSSEEEAPPCVSSAVSTWLSVGRYRLVRVVWHFQVRQHERFMKEGVWLFPRGGASWARGE